MKFKALPALLPWFALMGCTSMPYGNATEPSFHVYEDILQGSAISDSPLFQSAPPNPALAAVACQQSAPSQAAAAVAAGTSDPTLISPVSAPGLYAMLSQVDPKNRMLASSTGTAPAPLPPELARLPLTRAYVTSLAASYHNSRVRRLAKDPCVGPQIKAASDIVVAGRQPPLNVPNEYSVARELKAEFSVKDLADFGQVLLTTNFALVNNPAAALGLNPPAPAANAATNPTFGQFLAQYLLAYYNGNFVDRDGTQPTKPSIGLTITDTTLSTVATVGMDAIYDYIVLTTARQGGGDVIKAPVVYDASATQSAGATGKSGTTSPAVKWQNPKNLQPTLAAIILPAIQMVKVTTATGNKSATVALTGQPTNGTFTLTIESKTTSGIAYNASAADVQTAVQKLATTNTKTATVTGPAGGPYVITFPAAPSGGPVTASGSGLGMKYVVEQLAKNGDPGMTPAKIQLVRLLQGLAGDGATGLNGLIMRTFGGVHIGVTAGLGVLGKISVGDNNTLANLVEAVTGVFAANSTELFASDQLYDITYPPNPSTTGNPLAIAVLQFISNLNLSPPATSAPGPTAQAAAPHFAYGDASWLRLSETDR